MLRKKIVLSLFLLFFSHSITAEISLSQAEQYYKQNQFETLIKMTYRPPICEV